MPSARKEGRPERDPVIREFLLAFWKIHILHHAEEQGVYGHWMLEELHHHGYRLSPGTLYPLLGRMVRHGWLRAAKTENVRDARVYRITPAGSNVLKRLRASLRELQGEVGGVRTAPSKKSRPARRS
ncbi:MAG: PadR family transcriptional regulator [Acidobacteriaceae bacterium]|nr:PadR family transcriptional regulator [Acidobacteriaceae bacterium]